MENIAKPNKINYEAGKEPNQGTITVEPFYPGYGMTLGNSLRRVLLSSLPGAAVIGVKIKGADHEFTSIPYVKEDVLEIILNLKKLSLKIIGKEEEDIKLELDVTGKKEVKAKDIKKNSKVEIVNPDLVLANITDVAGNLKMEITVSSGRGYKSVEQKKSDKQDIGFIEMDAVFSPVVSVGIDVENVRVGKMTNWDKLILDITTDGTLEPKEVFERSVKILVEQFNSLLDLDKKGKEEKKEEAEEQTSEKKEEKEEAEEEEKKEKKTATKKTTTAKSKSSATKKEKK